MQRIALCTFLFLSPLALAQTPEPEEVPEIKAVVGAPFSAVGVEEIVHVTVDGNRFIHKRTTHHYRDGQGRTRLDRELPMHGLRVNGTETPPLTLVIINNKVTGEIDSLQPDMKLATVVHRTGRRVVDVPVGAPEIFAWYSGTWIGPDQPGWSAPVSLGEKSIDGVHVVGTQKVYTVAPDTFGNQKPVTITVQQWVSTDLGVIVDKTKTLSTGGHVHYQLQQILQAEPNPDLFTVPADYKKRVIDPANGTAVAVGSSGSTTATTKQ